jgi:uncharacterized protein YjbJ (UPF0337 family)
MFIQAQRDKSKSKIKFKYGDAKDKTMGGKYQKLF